MKSSFTFDGTELEITLKVEGETEEAVADLMAKLTTARVHLRYENAYYRSQGKPVAVCFTLTEPVVEAPQVDPAYR